MTWTCCLDNKIKWNHKSNYDILLEYKYKKIVKSDDTYLYITLTCKKIFMLAHNDLENLTSVLSH